MNATVLKIIWNLSCFYIIWFASSGQLLISVFLNVVKCIYLFDLCVWMHMYMYVYIHAIHAIYISEAPGERLLCLLLVWKHQRCLVWWHIPPLSELFWDLEILSFDYLMMDKVDDLILIRCPLKRRRSKRRRIINNVSRKYWWEYSGRLEWKVGNWGTAWWYFIM